MMLVDKETGKGYVESGGNLFVKIGYRHCFYNGRIDNIIYLSYY